LAEVASGGATASSISEQKALEAIIKGHTFLPDKGRNLFLTLLFRKCANYWGLDPHMYYHQCMLFVSYLRSNNQDSFRKLLLLSIFDGKNFVKAWNESFKNDLSFYWDNFLNDIQKKKEKS
jgi:hypothetical protein